MFNLFIYLFIYSLKHYYITHPDTDTEVMRRAKLRKKSISLSVENLNNDNKQEPTIENEEDKYNEKKKLKHKKEKRDKKSRKHKKKRHAKKEKVEDTQDKKVKPKPKSKKDRKGSSRRRSRWDEFGRIKDSSDDLNCSDSDLKPEEWEYLTHKHHDKPEVYMDLLRREKLSFFCERPNIWDQHFPKWDDYRLNCTWYYNAVQRAFCEFFSEHKVCLCTAFCPKPLIPLKNKPKSTLSPKTFDEELYRRLEGRTAECGSNNKK